MDNVFFPTAVQLDQVDEIVGSTDWTGAKVHLYANDFTPTEATVLADFVAPIYSGYAPIALTWSAAFTDINGRAVSSGGEKLFIQAGATGDLVYGAFITNTAGSKLLASGRLDPAPFSFINNADTLPLTIKIGLLDGSLAAAIVP